MMMTKMRLTWWLLVRDEQRESRRTHGNGSLVHGASRSGKEDVHDDGHGQRSGVHGHGGSDEESLPGRRVGALNLFQTVLGPSVCKINQQDQTNQKEEHSADKSDIVSPEGEKGVGNEEGDDDQANPGNELGTPETILNSRSLVFSIADAYQEEGQDEMEEAQCEVDTVYGGESIALFAGAGDGRVIKKDCFQLLDGPVGEHNP